MSEFPQVGNKWLLEKKNIAQLIYPHDMYFQVSILGITILGDQNRQIEGEMINWLNKLKEAGSVCSAIDLSFEVNFCTVRVIQT